jgi:uncharacterized Zn finger protein (UPF0148 family)
MTRTKQLTPKQFLNANKITVNVGDVLNPTELGMPVNMAYGPLPVVEVTEAKEGAFVSGIASCNECGTQIVIHAGDWFQKRRCEKCQKRAQRHAVNPPMTEEQKAAKLLEREAAKAATAAKHADEKAAKAQARAALIQQKAEEKAVKIRAEAEAKAQKLFQKAATV